MASVEDSNGDPTGRGQRSGSQFEKLVVGESARCDTEPGEVFAAFRSSATFDYNPRLDQFGHCAL